MRAGQRRRPGLRRGHRVRRGRSHGAAARAGGRQGRRTGRPRLPTPNIQSDRYLWPVSASSKTTQKLHLRTKLRTSINRTNTIKQIEERKILFLRIFIWVFRVSGGGPSPAAGANVWISALKNVGRVNGAAGVRTLG